MKTRISALVDGELEAQDVDVVLAALREDASAQECWQTYHLISDAMRDLRMTSPGFCARVEERLEAEPTVLAPAALAATTARNPARLALSVAAGVAAVALVGGLALLSTQEVPAPLPLAAAVAEKPAARAPAASAAPAALAVAPLPGAANDYLLAHQGYSPRVVLQGVAPYVRTVAEPAGDLRAR